MASEPRQSGGVDRRRFLLLTGLALGASAGAGVAIGEAIVGHGSAPSAAPPRIGSRTSGSTTPTATPVVRRRPPTSGDWTALRGELSSGRLVLPTDTGYDSARLLFDPKFDSSRPAAIAYCAKPAEVSACLTFTPKFGIPLAARIVAALPRENAPPLVRPWFRLPAATLGSTGLAGALAGAAPAGIALRTAAQSPPPVRAGCRHRHARRDRRTRRRYGGRHPRGSK